MNSSSVTEATKAATAEIRRRLEPFGVVDGAFEAFRAGHMPEKGPYWYSATVFNGLSEFELNKLECRLPFPAPEQAKAVIPTPLRQFLTVTNGMRCHNLAIYGDQGRIDQGAGAPFDLSNPQLVRPPNVPKRWFCFGSMNGPWASQGELYLTESEEVVLVHRDTGDIGERWSDLSEFLSSEITRILSSHDAKGDMLPGAFEFPGDTADWEAKAERARYGPFGWKKLFRGLSIWLANIRHR